MCIRDRYSIGLACTLSVWACTLLVWCVLYWFGLHSNGLAKYSICVLYRVGLYSIGLALYFIDLGLYSISLTCTLSVWPVLYRFGPAFYWFGLLSVGLAFTLTVWPNTLSVYSIGLGCTLSVSYTHLTL